MTYKLEITPHAEQQIDNCIQYVCQSLHSRQGASAIIDDIQSAFATLEICAEGFAYCEDPHLHMKGYRKLALSQHDYVLIYQIISGTVYIMGFFHMKENYYEKL